MVFREKKSIIYGILRGKRGRDIIFGELEGKEEKDRIFYGN